MIITNSEKCPDCGKSWNISQGIIPINVKCNKCNTIKEMCFNCSKKKCSCGGQYISTLKPGILA
jgi:hypothetical protein